MSLTRRATSPRDRDLDQLAPREDVPRRLDRRSGDKGAPIRRKGHDVVVSERLQRAANGGPACAEDRAELFFGQLRAGRQALLDDRFEDALINRLHPQPARGRMLGAGRRRLHMNRIQRHPLVAPGPGRIVSRRKVPRHAILCTISP